MKYTNRQIEKTLAEWNAAASQLPLVTPETYEDRGVVKRDQFVFESTRMIDGLTGKVFIQWELLSSDWRRTGVIWRADQLPFKA